MTCQVSTVSVWIFADRLEVFSEASLPAAAEVH